MAKYNAENERIKREYMTYLKAAKGLSEASLDAVAKAIHRFDESNRQPSLEFDVSRTPAHTLPNCGENDRCFHQDDRVPDAHPL